MRITWDDDTSVHVYFTKKSAEKNSVAVQHVGLSSKADATKMKGYWAERLAVLGEILE